MLVAIGIQELLLFAVALDTTLPAAFFALFVHCNALDLEFACHFGFSLFQNRKASGLFPRHQANLTCEGWLISELLYTTTSKEYKFLFFSHGGRRGE
jgi:hypothetical protein